MVQEALLRVHSALERGEEISSPRAYVATVATRLAIDELRSARARRESYVGEWLPEPCHRRPRRSGRQAEHADSLSLAFLVVLEILTPEQRAAFLLHDVFDYGYGRDRRDRRHERGERAPARLTGAATRAGGPAALRCLGGAARRARAALLRRGRAGRFRRARVPARRGRRAARRRRRHRARRSSTRSSAAPRWPGCSRNWGRRARAIGGFGFAASR